ncbi:Class I histocompatibility antigen, F10 alpha chain [Liparis tanakae]|uniref:Class I histocompatibility antigen, F10 alpha chain n=1 Tax=Liparis tanakae TaxID=230148 RepID=A0A4Z2H863_9TELE|nr:Class I histocompatibility antigen, F10 alpha chain [Liparis tanakae]
MTPSVIHSLKYFLTASSGVPNFPEFVYVGLVDEHLMLHYDSNTKRAEPKQAWMSRVTEEDPQYLKRNTEVSKFNQHVSVVNIDILKKRFNYGFDGEDFLSYDLETESWVAPRQQAVPTKHRNDMLEWSIGIATNVYVDFEAHPCRESGSAPTTT